MRGRLEAGLAAARLALARAPDDTDARIWVGRRLAYLGRYREPRDQRADGHLTTMRD